MIVDSLKTTGLLWIHSNHKQILQQVMHQTVTEWHEIRQMLVQIETLEKTPLQKVKGLFAEALIEELQRTRRLVLDQIGFYVPNTLAQKAIMTLKGSDLNAYAAAASCVQDVLSKKIYHNIKDIILYPTIDTPPKHIKNMSEHTFLNYFILTPPKWTSPWMQALALYGWRELNDKTGLMAVQTGLKSPDWIVLEAALSALGHLEKDRKKKEELVLTIPTRYLLNKNFENLLEDKQAHHN